MSDTDLQAAIYASCVTAFKGKAGRILSSYNFSNNYNNNNYYRSSSKTAGISSNKAKKLGGFGRLASEGIVPVNTTRNNLRNNNADYTVTSINNNKPISSSVQSKPANNIIHGSPRKLKNNANNNSPRHRNANTNTANKPKASNKLIGSNWIRTNEGSGRATYANEELCIEGVSANTLYILKHNNSNNNGSDITVSCECKCIGTVYFMFNLNCDTNFKNNNTDNVSNSSDLSYLAISMSTANKCWNLEIKRKNRANNTILATAADQTLKSSQFHSITIEFKQNKLTLTVDDHTFFDNIDCSGMDTNLNLSSIGIGVLRSKAVIKHWKYNNLTLDHATNNVNYTDNNSAIISDQTMRVFGSKDSTLSDQPGESKMNSDNNNPNIVDHSNTPVPRPAYNGPEARDLIELIETTVIDRDLGVTLDDIASLQDAKLILKESVIVPLLLPNFFSGIRNPLKGILLYGPPGTGTVTNTHCISIRLMLDLSRFVDRLILTKWKFYSVHYFRIGKTLLARAIASVSEVTFFNVNSSILTSKWRGESEKLVTTLFNMARYYSPSIIFLDEIDSLFLQRGTHQEHEASRAFKSVMFSQIDGLHSNNNTNNNSTNGHVMIIGTSNCPFDLDQAIRRRLEKRIYIPMPDLAARKQMFEIHLRSIKLSPDVSFDRLAALTEGFSGSDIKIICRDAALLPFRKLVENLNPTEIRALNNSEKLNFSVCEQDFIDAISKVQPSVSSEDVKRYEQWQKEFGSN